MKKLLPLLELLRIKDRPNSLRGLERDQRLAIMGYSPDEIEQLTGFKQGQYKFLSSELDEGQELNEKSGLD